MIYSLRKTLVQINQELANEKGDFFYSDKKRIKENPNTMFLGGNVGHFVFVILCQPNLIKEFISVQDKYYEKAPLMKSLTNILMKDGLLLSERTQWKRHRKIVSSVFHFEFLKQMIPMVIETTNELFDEVAKRSDLSSVSIMDEIQSITGEVVGRSFFGKSLRNKVGEKPITKELAELIGTAMLLTFTPINILFGPKFIKMGILPNHKNFMERTKNFRKFCEEAVEARRKDFESGIQTTTIRKDLLQAFFEAQVKNPEDKLSVKEIVDEFATFFVAGMDTTGHTITIMLYYLHSYPDIIQKVK